MTVALQKFSGSDEAYAALEQIEKEVWPNGYETAAEQKHIDKEDEAYFFGRIVAMLNNEMVGHATYVETHWSPTPDEYYLQVRVRPKYQNRGIGAQLYDHMVEQLPQPKILLTESREDKPHGMRFIEKRGFKLAQRAPVSHLDLTTFDPAPYAGLDAKMESLGVNIYSLTELAAIEPDWLQKIWEFRHPIRADVPSIFEKKEQSLERFVSQIMAHPSFTHDGYFVAIGPATSGNDEYLGWSALHTSEADPEKLYTSMTGVKRDWRRKGVATALKLRAITWAKESYGAKLIETDNEENNPMYDLNMQLGFKPQPAWIGYKKEIND